MTDCDCGTERVAKTVKCGTCSIMISVNECPDCGLKVRSTFPSECNCWMDY